MQLRRLAALERQKIIDELAEIEREIADLKDILEKPERQRQIVKDELSEIVEKYGDDRRTRIIAADGDVTDEDLIAREDVVVTITETGYAKRTRTDLYRSQKRGGKGVKGAELKQEDIVKNFRLLHPRLAAVLHTKGRVYRAKAYELPEANRTARGQHVANLLAFQPDEKIQSIIQSKSYEDAPPGAGHPQRPGEEVPARRLRLQPQRRHRRDQPARRGRAGGRRAVLVGRRPAARLRQGPVDPLRATDEALRPMGRATSGVQGMRFNQDDELLSLNVVREGTYLLVATSGGYAKRTPIEDYVAQGRGGKGVLTIQYDPKRGTLVGAVIVDDDDELYAITSGGGVIRTAAKQVARPAARRRACG